MKIYWIIASTIAAIYGVFFAEIWINKFTSFLFVGISTICFYLSYIVELLKNMKEGK